VGAAVSCKQQPADAGALHSPAEAYARRFLRPKKISTIMKAILASILVATLLWGCGGGGGDAGACSGSPEYCAQFAEEGAGQSGGTGAPVSLAFSKSGTGDAVFDLPLNVTRLRVQAKFNGAMQIFFVEIGGVPMIFTTVGSSQTPPTLDRTLVVRGGATVEISGSSGVEWVMTQVFPEQ
jgi:hypothetical protein